MSASAVRRVAALKQEDGGRNAPPASPAGASTALPELVGRYKSFFTEEAATEASRFYHITANKKQRETFKQVVRDIMKFDVAEAKRKLRIGFAADVPAAHAIVLHNGGNLMRPEIREQAVMYVAFAPQAARQAFRETFGLIAPPSLTCLHKTQYRRDFAEETKHMKGENMLRDQSRPVMAKKEMKPFSYPTTAECEVVGDGKSQYGLFYAWKVAPKLGLNVTQRAHEASFEGAPWGNYGASNQSQWVTHAKEDEQNRDFVPPTTVFNGLASTCTLGKRRFQNYNDNVAHEIYRTQSLLRKGRVLPGEKNATIDRQAAASVNIMQPERAPNHNVYAGPPVGLSPIFCR